LLGPKKKMSKKHNYKEVSLLPLVLDPSTISKPFITNSNVKNPDYMIITNLIILYCIYSFHSFYFLSILSFTPINNMAYQTK